MEQKIWHCPICGQDFTGPEPPSPCPVCGAPASVFTSVDAPAPKQWRCLICGQVFEGDKPPVPCPVCGAGEQAFVPEESGQTAFRKDTQERFVLLGGGAAGLECAKAIRQRNQTAQITLVCAEPVLPYNRPALSDVVADGLSLSAILLQEADWYAQQSIQVKTGVRAVQIHRQDRQVQLSDGSSLPYDKLLLALGSRAFVPVEPNPAGIPLYVLRSHADSQQVIQAAGRAHKAIVVGGGILGIEAALALRERGIQVTVVEFAPRLMVNQADEVGSALLQEALEKKGLAIRCGVGVQQVEAHGALLTDGSRLDGDFLLCAAGVRSETALAQDCGLAVERGILVDEQMRTSDPCIFAAGDCAQFQGKTGGLWSTATAQGQTAGMHMAGDDSAPYVPQAVGTVLEGTGISLFSCGAVNAPSSQTLTYEDRFSGVYQRVFLQDGHVIGALLWGDTSSMGSALDVVGRKAPAREAAGILG